MEISARANNSSSFNVLIAAAGSGSRMGDICPKQYVKIQGKSILRHTIERFLACPGLQELRVIINPDHRGLYEEAVKDLSLPPPIAGGIDRKTSIYNGVKSFSNLKNNEYLLIHDAARPFVRQQEIINVAGALTMHQAATLAVPVADSLRHTEGSIIDRSDLWAIQTPQAFHYGVIRDAHEHADPKKEYSDDTSLVSARGVDVAIVQGHRQNFKITTTDDMEMAEILMCGQTTTETRTGTGYDVHAFTTGSGVRLCGVDIPHDKALSGHSDADVGLHALTDALLGTIAAGDIGLHFPPSDPQWQGVDSAVFLQKAVELVADQKAHITSVDVTLVCESPKIGPHRESMQQRVAEICGLLPSRVSVKATTTEGLGFTGRGEGIAAQAVATIQLPVKAHHEN